MTTTTMISSFALMAFLDTILPPPSLPACVSLAFETRAFASNRRETVRTNINYNPYLNPHPPKRAYPLCKRISLPSPSFSKVNTYIRNLPSPEFHRDEFRYASAFIRKIYLLPSILPKKRKRSSKRNEEESRFFLSFFQNREILQDELFEHCWLQVFRGRSRANIARNRCAGGPPVWWEGGDLVDIRLDKEGGALKAR